VNPLPWRELPHGPGYVFIDRVVEIELGSRARGVKLVTAGEPMLAGHLPDDPAFPGVLILEALAQLGGLAWLGAETGQGAFLAGITTARFGRRAVPGDALALDARVAKVLGNIARVQAAAHVDGEEALSAELTLARSWP